VLNIFEWIVYQLNRNYKLKAKSVIAQARNVKWGLKLVNDEEALEVVVEVLAD
jgi:hypothetical protein